MTTLLSQQVRWESSYYLRKILFASIHVFITAMKFIIKEQLNFSGIGI